VEQKGKRAKVHSQTDLSAPRESESKTMEFQLDRSNSAIALSEIIVNHTDNNDTTYIDDSDAHERRRNEGWGRNLFLAYNTLGVVLWGLLTSPLLCVPFNAFDITN
ncbi:hypothetical protein GIB67_022959, partial [Kingdonia uniflora]